MRTDLLINDFTLRALHDRALVLFEGKYRRTCVHVRDVARAFVHVIRGQQRHYSSVFYADRPAEEGWVEKIPLGIYNAGACTMTKLSLCEAIQKQVPGFTYVEAPIAKDPDQRDYCVAMDKIAATGFTPEWTLDMGIAELLKGYRMLGVGPHRKA